MKKPEPNVDNEYAVNTLIVIMILAAIALLVLSLTHAAKATEYFMIDKDDLTYCDTFARRSAVDMVAMNVAYGDCIRILPTRLPMPAEMGTVPATADPDRETWAEACDREYRTWDAATGTVVRRGSPDRVECPLVLVDGEWVIPTE